MLEQAVRLRMSYVSRNIRKSRIILDARFIMENVLLEQEH
jgi:hypothetical protein